MFCLVLVGVANDYRSACVLIIHGAPISYMQRFGWTFLELCDVEYRKGPYRQQLYFGLNHFCSKFNTLSRTYSMDLHPERRIWQFYYGSSADWSKYITGSCKINALEVDGPTSIGLFWSISNVGKSPSIDSSL